MNTGSLNVSDIAGLAAGVMATILYILAASFVAPGTVAIASAGASPPEVTEAMTTADKMVSDLLQLDPRRMTAGNGEAWIVGEITPDKKSGVAIGPGANLDNKGVSHMRPGPIVMPISGTCRVITVLAGQFEAKEWHYAWQQPAVWAISASSGKEKEPWGKQLRPGAAIVKINKQIKDKNPLEEVLIIPAEWENQVRDAMVYVKDHPEVLDEKVKGEDAAAVQDKLHDPNPWLRMCAARTLAARGLFTADMAKPRPEMIWQEQAVYYVLLARSGEADERQKTAKVYESFIGAARTADDVKGLAAGAFHLRSQFPRNDAGNTMARQTLGEIRKRNTLQDGSSPSAAYLRDMLKVEAVQQLYDQREGAGPKKSADK